jgi:hypothetical protein
VECVALVDRPRRDVKDPSGLLVTAWATHAPSVRLLLAAENAVEKESHFRFTFHAHLGPGGEGRGLTPMFGPRELRTWRMGRGMPPA